MAVTSGPIGYQYDPEDHELIIALNYKLQNKPIPFDQSIDRDLYSNSPSTLLRNIQPVIKRTKEYVIYTPRYRFQGSTGINRRVLGGKIGIWKQVSNFECRCDDDGNAVGIVTRFVFFQGDVDVGNLRKTDWSMKELTTMKDDDDQFAFCKVSNQPLRDDDDDDDDDDDEEEEDDSDDDDDDDEDEDEDDN